METRDAETSSIFSDHFQTSQKSHQGGDRLSAPLVKNFTLNFDLVTLKPSVPMLRNPRCGDDPVMAVGMETGQGGADLSWLYLTCRVIILRSSFIMSRRDDGCKHAAKNTSRWVVWRNTAPCHVPSRLKHRK